MSDIIERAEAWRDRGLGSDPVPELIAALKSARAENESLRSDAEMWRGVQQMYGRMTP